MTLAAERTGTLSSLPSRLQPSQNIFMFDTSEYLYQRTYQTHCGALNVKKLVTVKMPAEEERPVPRVVRLATPAATAQMNQSAPTALPITLPSVKAA